MNTYLLLGSVLVQSIAVAQTSIEQQQCGELNELVLARAAANRLNEAEAAISAAVSQGESLCAGVVSAYVATLMSVQGRFRDSEAYAVRSVDLLRKTVDPDDPVLLRPLHFLATARLEQGKFRTAEQAFEQMLKVRAERPEQRGQIHLTRGMLRQMEGDLREAESEYLRAYEEWKTLGKAADADAAAAFNYLGTIYISEARYQEAAQVLDRALGIVAVAENAHPLDRINLLNTRASAHARQGEWLEAQEKLRLAVALAEGAGVTDPALLRSVLKNYAIALRKNHHRREARAIENQVSALRADPGTVAVVDVHELSSDLKARPHD